MITDIFNEDKVHYSASIEFKNNNTSGSQKIEASSFNDLLERVDEFVKTLK